ncbi:MAG TPA: hypothetical protein VEK07_04400 [Polyangiaceae bacterium]|nr:hypothetical protein [Polyangiaceae bacterium]
MALATRKAPLRNGSVYFRRGPLSRALTAASLPVVLGAAVHACASSGHGSPFGSTSGGSGSAAGASGETVSAGGSGDLGAGNSGLAGSSGDGGSAGAAQVCTDAGCTCIRIASIGHEGIWGACGMYGDSTSAFETWLNTQSTAMVDTYTTKPTLSASFLEPYNVIILQWLRDVSDGGADGALWEFSQDEVDALAAWVKGGGGLITLSGYDGDGAEVTPLNGLLSFTDFQYNMDATYGADCSACWGGACALTGWNITTPIGAHITQVGIQFGRSISVAANPGYAPTIDCPCPVANQCAVHEDVGSGHVFAFTDEWVTYTSQWLGTASCISSSCEGGTAQDDFQVPQFWYNAIAYASSSAQCFVIQNPTIVPR